jgi:hypothetical protein
MDILAMEGSIRGGGPVFPDLDVGESKSDFGGGGGGEPDEVKSRWTVADLAGRI